jgi:hypothetical protein
MSCGWWCRKRQFVLGGCAVRYRICIRGEIYSFGASTLNEAQRLAEFIRRDGRAALIVDMDTGLAVPEAQPKSASVGGAIRLTPPPWVK